VGFGAALAQGGLANGPLFVGQGTVRKAFDESTPPRVASESWSDYSKKAGRGRSQRAALRGVIEDWPSVSARLRTLVRTPDEVGPMAWSPRALPPG
jgi:hypothetical protein